MTQPADNPGPILALKPARVQRSDDGGWRSDTYGDVYFQLGVGIEESHFVFLEKNRLAARFADLWQAAAAGAAPGHFTLVELGLGSGLNLMLVWQLWRDTAAQHADLDPARQPQLHLISIEKHPLVPEDLAALHAEWPQLVPVSADFRALYPPLVAGFHVARQDNVTLQLLFGDVAEMLPRLDVRADAWFLDGFSPAKNPAMWVDELFPLIAARTAPGGTLSTFSSAGRIRKALAAVGFTVKKVTGFGIKWSMSVAEMPGDTAPQPPRPRIAVIGAGIAGASAARALADLGCPVTVFERHDSIAPEASGNPVGILYPKPTVDASPMGRFYMQAFCHTRQALRRLKPQDWRPCGVLRLDMDDAAALRSQKLMTRHEFPPDVCQWQPTTFFGRSAMSHPAGGMINPASFVAALLDHPLISLRLGETIAAPVAGFDATVIATANAAESFDPQLPLKPLRGQMVTLRATPASDAALTTVVCHDGYITPAVDGHHYAGATFQKEGPDNPHDHRSTPRDADSADIVAQVNANLPGLAVTAADVTAARATYRATTPDKLPLVGALSDGIYIVAGFGAHGLTTAPLAGAVVASLICKTPLPIPADLLPYLQPDRFVRRGRHYK